MIRQMQEEDLDDVMRIWLDSNIKAHHFIPKEYWISHFEMVKNMMPQAEVYLYEDSDKRQIEGFIGLMDQYIAGIFVKETAQSKGIGKELLDYVKKIKKQMHLGVYQKNMRAVSFYKREGFVIQSENWDESTGEKEFCMTYCL